MRQVIITPEKCVGCMQCMLACATAHSRSLTLFAASQEIPKPKSRVHVATGLWNQGFPNRCRHCDPPPCQSACLANAISRDNGTGTVFINADRCINCASCAMACPYGVIRFHQDTGAPPGKTVAVKCDNCTARTTKGLLPACVEVCKTGALTYEEMEQAMARKTRQVSRAMHGGMDSPKPPPTVGLHKVAKQAALQTGGFLKF